VKHAGNSWERWKPGLIAAAVTGCVGALVVHSVLGDGLARRSYDLLFRLRPTIHASGVALVYMDEDEAKALSQPWKTAAWDRTRYAQLLDRLVACRVRAVVFDILFDTRGTNNQSNQILVQSAAAARRAGVPVVLGAQFKSSVSPEGLERFTTALALPFAELRDETSWGMVVAGALRGRVIRLHVPDEPNLPSLASRVAELALRRPAPATNVVRWINYYGPPQTIPRYGFSYVLSDEFPHAARLSNQVVFVGEAGPPAPLAGGGGTDAWPTPFTGSKYGESSGLEINATAYLNVAREDWLRRLPMWIEAAIALGLGSVLGLVLSRCRPMIATLAGITVVLVTGTVALWAMWQAQVWFPWLIVAGVQTPLAVGWAVLGYARRLSREKEFLERKVAVLEPALEIAAAAPHTSPSANVARAKPAGRESERDADAPAVSSSSAGQAADGGRRTPAIPDHTMLRCVGRGAYGEVWLARNAVGLWHAVKLVHRAAFNSQEPFEREFRGIQRFMPVSRLHPGLVQILHVGRDDASGWLYYVMEVGDDETTGQQIQPETYSPKNLAQEIQRRGRLPGAECVELGLALSVALEFLHAQQLIHRDIKPSNIIFVRGQPKFTDIGLVTEFATTSTDVSYLGTQGYIAPEGPGRPPADIFSLGRVLYEAWTGLPCASYPELPADVRQWPDRDLVLELNKIVIKACHPDVAKRYACAALMGEELQQLRRET
jgi:CHASE2 domain-containing sensor protein